MFCYKCGAKLDDDAKFCRQCGTEIFVPNKQTIEPVSTTKPRKSKKGILGVVLVVVLAFAVGFLLGAGTGNAKTQNNASNPPSSIENIHQENKNVAADKENTTQSCPIVIISQKSTGTEYGYSHAAFTVKNVSGETIHTLTLDIKILDENKTVLSTTHPQEGVRIADGESITIEALTEEGAYSMKLDGYSYYTGVDFDGDYVQGFFPSAEEVVLD